MPKKNKALPVNKIVKAKNSASQWGFMKKTGSSEAIYVGADAKKVTDSRRVNDFIPVQEILAPKFATKKAAIEHGRKQARKQRRTEANKKATSRYAKTLRNRQGALRKSHIGGLSLSGTGTLHINYKVITDNVLASMEIEGERPRRNPFQTSKGTFVIPATPESDALIDSIKARRTKSV